jgi:hypothetical protein
VDPHTPKPSANADVVGTLKASVVKIKTIVIVTVEKDIGFSIECSPERMPNLDLPGWAFYYLENPTLNSK